MIVGFVKNKIDYFVNLSSTVITHETGSGSDRGSETGRCRVHCLNGNCVDGRCQCRSGYQGEFCNERELQRISWIEINFKSNAYIPQSEIIISTRIMNRKSFQLFAENLA